MPGPESEVIVRHSNVKRRMDLVMLLGYGLATGTWCDGSRLFRSFRASAGRSPGWLPFESASGSESSVLSGASSLADDTWPTTAVNKRQNPTDPAKTLSALARLVIAMKTPDIPNPVATA